MQEQINRTSTFLLNFRYLVNKTGAKDCEMAEKLGIHKVSLSRYFSERRIPKRSVLEKIANYFEISCDDLLKTDLTKQQPKLISLRHTPGASQAEPVADITAAAVLMSKEQRAYLTTAARKLGLTLEEFILLAAMERAERTIGTITQTNSKAC